jgi:hypothetical protein
VAAGYPEDDPSLDCALMAEANDDRPKLPDDYTIAELHAISTRALANGDAYERGLLREQLEEEEFGHPSEHPAAPRFSLLALSGLLTIGLVGACAAATRTLDQSQAQTSNPGMGSVAAGTQWAAQTFTAGLSGNLDQVDLSVMRVSTPGALTVQIQGVVGGVPSGSFLASATVRESDVTQESGGWVVVRLNPSVVVSAGTQYAVVLSAPEGLARPPSVRMYLWNFVYGDPYPAGRVVKSANSGSSWELDRGDEDLAFKIYVTPPGRP